jgi:predicted amidohydrolase YtcJ
MRPTQATPRSRHLGRLEPGYAADFVLLKEDYFTQPEGEIWANAVLATVVAGQVVYAAPAGPLPGPATPSAP